MRHDIMLYEVGGQNSGRATDVRADGTQGSGVNGAKSDERYVNFR